MEEGAMFRKASLGIFLISGFLIITLRSGDTRQLKKRDHPDTYACPVNANLFPEEVKESNTFKYVFKSGAVVNRIGLSLQGEKNEEVEIQFNWIPEDTQVWRPVSCLIVVHCDGSPNCFFLGYHFNIPENVEAQEIRLTLLSNAQITSVAFSSLPSEKPMVLCPMPELEAEIQKAYLACVENPEDITNAYDFVVLLKKAMPEYDCRRSFDSKPVPAW